ncbi:MAG: acyltransferase family protein [Pseudomonadales bacterium]|nr:acyltransferase family protein [Pseudomonadales bacterium]
MNNRINYIDIAKGISIALVALHHSQLKSYFLEIIEPMSLFRMPLFFFLSGIFFSYVLLPKAFLLRKAEALLKPYFFVLVVLFLCSFLSGENALIWKLKGIFYGNGDTIRWSALWFLTHLFALYAFGYCLFYFFRFGCLSFGLQVAVLFCFLVVGSLFVDYFWYRSINIYDFSTELPGLPFSLDILLISSPYFILGYLLKDKVFNFRPNLLILIFFIGLFVCLASFSDAYIDLNKRIYVNPIVAPIGAILGIYIVLSCAWFFSKVDWLKLIFIRLGTASLFILIFHHFIEYNLFTFLSVGVAGDNNLLIVSVFSYLLSISIPLLIKKIVEGNELLSLAFFPFRSKRVFKRTFPIRSHAN